MMLNALVLEIGRVAAVVTNLGYAGIVDWLRRDIDPRAWVPGTVLGAVFSILELLQLKIINAVIVLSLIVTAMLVGCLAVAIFVFRAMGGADFLAILCIACSMPYPFLYLRGALGSSILPPLLHVLFYSALLSLLPVIHNVLHNLRRRELLNELGVSGWKKIRLVLMCKVLTVEEFAKKRFYYPIYVPGLVDRRSFDVEEDDRAWLDKIRGSGAKIVVATWGVPAVTMMWIAVLIYLALGVSPIDWVLAKTVG